MSLPFTIGSPFVLPLSALDSLDETERDAANYAAVLELTGRDMYLSSVPLPVSMNDAEEDENEEVFE